MNPPLQRQKIGLDNPAFAGRLRADARSSVPAAFPARIRPVALQHRPEPRVKASVAVKAAVKVVKPEPYARPAAPKLQSSRVLHRRALPRPVVAMRPAPAAQAVFESRRTVKRDNKRAQRALLAMAALVFVVGLGTAGQAYRTNAAAKRQVLALSALGDRAGAAQQSGQALAGTNTGTSTASANASSASADSKASTPLPSVAKLSAEAIAGYTVVGDAPRYIDIPVLQVHARVMPVGLLADGAMGTPNNIYDTNWYKASAKPGLPGATVIDGHVSSWTSHGVFYDLKNLVAGDTLSVQRGDGMVIRYRVVKTAIYPASGVDMKAALQPITGNKSGLNLISCTGAVKAGTSDFSKRIVVYSEQI